MIEIISVNTSVKKGEIKNNVEEIILNQEGIEGDIHAGSWHRQVSLLGLESITKFEKKLGREIRPGEFAENITTRGMDVAGITPLSIIANANIRLQVTQIGKKCHGKNCAIFRETGDCIMPAEGVFARVLKGGTLRAGDTLEYIPKTINSLVITLSDRVSRGEYEDISGPLLKNRIQEFIGDLGWESEINLCVVPDEIKDVQKILKDEGRDHDLIFTTGSTGIGPRDVAPEAIKPMLDKEIPGIMEMIRVKYGMEKHNALLSRSIAGVMGQSLVYCLPGSPKAIEEYTKEIFKTLRHSLLMLHSIDSH
jgi:molybdenum cofactor synthesis domain-containing protein